MVDSDIVVAAIAGIFAIAGSLVTTLANYLSEKSKSEKDEKAHEREERQKWLDDRRSAYIKFILAFSKPFSLSDVQDYWENLVRASSEAYLYGDLSPGISFNIPSLISTCSGVLTDTEIEEVTQKALERMSDFGISRDGVNAGAKIDSLSSLVVLLSNLRPFFSSILSIKLESEDKDIQKIKGALENYSTDLRLKALNGFMAVFLDAINEDNKIVST